MVRKLIYLGIPLVVGLTILILVGGFLLLFHFDRIVKGVTPEKVAELAEWNEMVENIQRNDTAWVAMKERYYCAGNQQYSTGSTESRFRLIATDDITGNKLILNVDVDRELDVERFVTCVTVDGQQLHRAWGPATIDYINNNDCVPPQEKGELWVDSNTFLICPGGMVNIGPADSLTYTEEDAQIMAAYAIELYKDDPQMAFNAIQDMNDLRFHNNNNLYVFILDENQTVLSHGVRPDLIGTSPYDKTDMHGTHVGGLFANNLEQSGQWLEYYWPNSTGSGEEYLQKTWSRYYQGVTINVDTRQD